MAYIGANWPDLQAPGRMVETFTVNAGAGPYTLTRRVVGGDPADIEVFIDNVRQQPTTAYTIGGTGNNIEKQITFTAAPTNGIAFYVVHVGPPVWESAPADSSVTNTKLAPSSITGHTAETTVADDDVILMYDTSASVLRKITRANFKTAAIAALKDADNNTKIQVEESADENKIRFDTAGTERMIIAADGKVGIGTTSPSQPLHIKHPSGGTYFRLEDGSSSYKYDLGVENGQGNALVLNDVNANAIRMVVKTDGKVGIGVTSPSNILHLKPSSGDTLLYMDGGQADANCGLFFRDSASNNQGSLIYDTDDDQFRWTCANAEKMRLKSNGNLGIGTTNPNYPLDVNGEAHASSHSNSSDKRLKKNVTELTSVLDKVIKLRGVSFYWDTAQLSWDRRVGYNTETKQIGMIADEVEEYFPELITTWHDCPTTRWIDEATGSQLSKEDYEKMKAAGKAVRCDEAVNNGTFKGMEYSRFTAILLQAIKELKIEVDELKAKG